MSSPRPSSSRRPHGVRLSALAPPLDDTVSIERIGGDPAASGRWDSLSATFTAATRLEIAFWDMGLDPNG